MGIGTSGLLHSHWNVPSFSPYSTLEHLGPCSKPCKSSSWQPVLKAKNHVRFTTVAFKNHKMWKGPGVHTVSLWRTCQGQATAHRSLGGGVSSLVARFFKISSLAANPPICTMDDSPLKAKRVPHSTRHFRNCNSALSSWVFEQNVHILLAPQWLTKISLSEC